MGGCFQLVRCTSRKSRHGADKTLRVMHDGFVSMIQPMESQNSQVRVMALRRGVHSLSRMRISTRFPFGVLHKTLELRKKNELLVRPHITQPSQEVLKAIEAQRVERRGLLRSKREDNDVVFASLREYVPGDSIRQIAWKPSARREGFRYSSKFGGWWRTTARCDAALSNERSGLGSVPSRIRRQSMRM